MIIFFFGNFKYIVKINFTCFFLLFNVATRELAIKYVACITFLLDSAGLGKEGTWDKLLSTTSRKVRAILETVSVTPNMDCGFTMYQHCAKCVNKLSHLWQPLRAGNSCIFQQHGCDLAQVTQPGWERADPPARLADPRALAPNHLDTFLPSIHQKALRKEHIQHGSLYNMRLNFLWCLCCRTWSWFSCVLESILAWQARGWVQSCWMDSGAHDVCPEGRREVQKSPRARLATISCWWFGHLDSICIPSVLLDRNRAFQMGLALQIHSKCHKIKWMVS